MFTKGFKCACNSQIKKIDYLGNCYYLKDLYFCSLSFGTKISKNGLQKYPDMCGRKIRLDFTVTQMTNNSVGTDLHINLYKK